MSNRKTRNVKPRVDKDTGLMLPKGIYLKKSDDLQKPLAKRIVLRIDRFDIDDPMNRETTKRLEEFQGRLTGDHAADQKKLYKLGEQYKAAQKAADNSAFVYETFFPEGRYADKDRVSPVAFAIVATEALHAFRDSKGGKVSAKELSHRERKIENLFIPYFGRRTPIPQIGFEEVWRFVFQDGFDKGTGAKTKANVLVLLRGIFKYAIQQGYIAKDPTSDPKLVYALAQQREDEKTDKNNASEVQDVRPFSKEEMRELVKACDAAGHTPFERDTFKAIVKLGALTGLRSGELFGLAWEDISISKDKKEGTIIVHRQCQGVNDFKLPKNVTMRNKVRHVDLTEDSIKVILEQYERVKDCPPVEFDMKYQSSGAKPMVEQQKKRFLFTSDKKRDEYIKGAHNFDGSWKRIYTAFQERYLGKYKPLSPKARGDAKLAEQELKAQREAVKPWRLFYNLRHTFASQLLSAGVPVSIISAQLGHKDETTTREHYAQYIADDTKNFGSLLHGALKSLGEEDEED